MDKTAVYDRAKSQNNDGASTVYTVLVVYGVKTYEEVE